MTITTFLNSLPGELESQARPAYTVRTAAYALQPQPPVEPIEEGLINRGDLVMVYGHPGSKKTYAAISQAICVAMEKDWLTFKTHKTKILFIDEESGERRFCRRLSLAIRGELGDETIPFEFVSLAGFKLDDPNDAMLVKALIEETGAGLVFIDALADIMDGDENAKKDTQPVFAALRKIADQTNAAIVIIHHSNKAGDYRGSSAIKGAVDLMIEVKSDDGSRFVQFKTTKERDIERISWAAEAVWTEDQFYLSATENQEKPFYSKSESYVIRFLQEHQTAGIDEIMDHADTCTSNAARAAVYTLTNKGLLKRTDSGGRGQKAIYAFTDKGCKL